MAPSARDRSDIHPFEAFGYRLKRGKSNRGSDPEGGQYSLLSSESALYHVDRDSKPYMDIMRYMAAKVFQPDTSGSMQKVLLLKGSNQTKNPNPFLASSDDQALAATNVFFALISDRLSNDKDKKKEMQGFLRACPQNEAFAQELDNLAKLAENDLTDHINTIWRDVIAYYDDAQSMVASQAILSFGKKIGLNSTNLDILSKIPKADAYEYIRVQVIKKISDRKPFLSQLANNLKQRLVQTTQQRPQAQLQSQTNSPQVQREPLLQSQLQQPSVQVSLSSQSVVLGLDQSVSPEVPVSISSVVVSPSPSVSSISVPSPKKAAVEDTLAQASLPPEPSVVKPSPAVVTPSPRVRQNTMGSPVEAEVVLSASDFTAMFNNKDGNTPAAATKFQALYDLVRKQFAENVLKKDYISSDYRIQRILKSNAVEDKIKELKKAFAGEDPVEISNAALAFQNCLKNVVKAIKAKNERRKPKGKTPVETPAELTALKASADDVVSDAEGYAKIAPFDGYGYRQGVKEGGIHESDVEGGQYRDNKHNVTHLIKRDTKKPQNDIAEYMAAKVFGVTAPGSGCEVYLTKSKNTGNTFLASKYFGDYRDLFVFLGQKERAKTSEPYATKAFQDKQPNGQYRFSDYERIIVTSLLIDDFSVHSGNIGAISTEQHPTADTPARLVRIDFGAAFRKFETEVKPEKSISDRVGRWTLGAAKVVGLGEKNYLLRDHPKERRQSEEFADELRRVAAIDLTEQIDKTWEDIVQYYDTQAIKDFGEQIGVPKDQLEAVSADDEQLSALVKQHFTQRMSARQQSMIRMAEKIEADLDSKQTYAMTVDRLSHFQQKVDKLFADTSWLVLNTPEDTTKSIPTQTTLRGYISQIKENIRAFLVNLADFEKKPSSASHVFYDVYKNYVDISYNLFLFKSEIQKQILQLKTQLANPELTADKKAQIIALLGVLQNLSRSVEKQTKIAVKGKQGLVSIEDVFKTMLDKIVAGNVDGNSVPKEQAAEYLQSLTMYMEPVGLIAEDAIAKAEGFNVQVLAHLVAKEDGGLRRESLDELDKKFQEIAEKLMVLKGKLHDAEEGPVKERIRNEFLKAYDDAMNIYLKHEKLITGLLQKSLFHFDGGKKTIEKWTPQERIIAYKDCAKLFRLAGRASNYLLYLQSNTLPYSAKVIFNKSKDPSDPEMNFAKRITELSLKPKHEKDKMSVSSLHGLLRDGAAVNDIEVNTLKFIGVGNSSEEVAAVKAMFSWFQEVHHKEFLDFQKKKKNPDYLQDLYFPAIESAGLLSAKQEYLQEHVENLVNALTRHVTKLYKDVPASEWYQASAFANQDKMMTQTPHVYRLNGLQQNIENWALQTVLRETDLNERTVLLATIIDMAYQAAMVNHDYFTAEALHMALLIFKATPQLAATFAGLSTTAQGKLVQINGLFAANGRKLQEAVDASVAPIPNLSLLQRQLRNAVDNNLDGQGSARQIVSKLSEGIDRAVVVHAADKDQSSFFDEITALSHDEIVQLAQKIPTAKSAVGVEQQPAAPAAELPAPVSTRISDVQARKLIPQWLNSYLTAVNVNFSNNETLNDLQTFIQRLNEKAALPTGAYAAVSKVVADKLGVPFGTDVTEDQFVCLLKSEQLLAKDPLEPRARVLWDAEKLLKDATKKITDAKTSTEVLDAYKKFKELADNITAEKTTYRTKLEALIHDAEVQWQQIGNLLSNCSDAVHGSLAAQRTKLGTQIAHYKQLQGYIERGSLGAEVQLADLIGPTRSTRQILLPVDQLITENKVAAQTAVPYCLIEQREQILLDSAEVLLAVSDLSASTDNSKLLLANLSLARISTYESAQKRIFPLREQVGALLQAMGDLPVLAEQLTSAGIINHGIDTLLPMQQKLQMAQSSLAQYEGLIQAGLKIRELIKDVHDSERSGAVAEKGELRRWFDTVWTNILKGQLDLNQWCDNLVKYKENLDKDPAARQIFHAINTQIVARFAGALADKARDLFVGISKAEWLDANDTNSPQKAAAIKWSKDLNAYFKNFILVDSSPTTTPKKILFQHLYTKIELVCVLLNESLTRGDYFTAGAIYAALSSENVRRLIYTTATGDELRPNIGLSAQSEQVLSKAKTIFSSENGYQALQQELADNNMAIPSLEIYRASLSSISEINAKNAIVASIEKRQEQTKARPMIVGKVALVDAISSNSQLEEQALTNKSQALLPQGEALPKFSSIVQAGILHSSSSLLAAILSPSLRKFIVDHNIVLVGQQIIGEKSIASAINDKKLSTKDLAKKLTKILGAKVSVELADRVQQEVLRAAFGTGIFDELLKNQELKVKINPSLKERLTHPLSTNRHEFASSNRNVRDKAANISALFDQLVKGKGEKSSTEIWREIVAGFKEIGAAINFADLGRLDGVVAKYLQKQGFVVNTLQGETVLHAAVRMLADAINHDHRAKQRDALAIIHLLLNGPAATPQDTLAIAHAKNNAGQTPWQVLLNAIDPAHIAKPLDIGTWHLFNVLEAEQQGDWNSRLYGMNATKLKPFVDHLFVVENDPDGARLTRLRADSPNVLALTSFAQQLAVSLFNKFLRPINTYFIADGKGGFKFNDDKYDECRAEISKQYQLINKLFFTVELTEVSAKKQRDNLLSVYTNFLMNKIVAGPDDRIAIIQNWLGTMKNAVDVFPGCASGKDFLSGLSLVTRDYFVEVTKLLDIKENDIPQITKIILGSIQRSTESHDADATKAMKAAVITLEALIITKATEINQAVANLDAVQFGTEKTVRARLDEITTATRVLPSIDNSNFATVLQSFAAIQHDLEDLDAIMAQHLAMFPALDELIAAGKKANVTIDVSPIQSVIDAYNAKDLMVKHAALQASLNNFGTAIKLYLQNNTDDIQALYSLLTDMQQVVREGASEQQLVKSIADLLKSYNSLIAKPQVAQFLEFLKQHEAILPALISGDKAIAAKIALFSDHETISNGLKGRSQLYLTIIRSKKLNEDLAAELREKLPTLERLIGAIINKQSPEQQLIDEAENNLALIDDMYLPRLNAENSTAHSEKITATINDLETHRKWLVLMANINQPKIIDKLLNIGGAESLADFLNKELSEYLSGEKFSTQDAAEIKQTYFRAYLKSLKADPLLQDFLLQAAKIKSETGSTKKAISDIHEAWQKKSFTDVIAIAKRLGVYLGLTGGPRLDGKISVEDLLATGAAVGIKSAADLRSLEELHNTGTAAAVVTQLKTQAADCMKGVDVLLTEAGALVFDAANFSAACQKYTDSSAKLAMAQLSLQSFEADKNGVAKYKRLSAAFLGFSTHPSLRSDEQSYKSTYLMVAAQQAKAIADGCKDDVDHVTQQSAKVKQQQEALQATFKQYLAVNLTAQITKILQDNGYTDLAQFQRDLQDITTPPATIGVTKPQIEQARSERLLDPRLAKIAKVYEEINKIRKLAEEVQLPLVATDASSPLSVFDSFAKLGSTKLAMFDASLGADRAIKFFVEELQKRSSLGNDAEYAQSLFQRQEEITRAVKTLVQASTDTIKLVAHISGGVVAADGLMPALVGLMGRDKNIERQIFKLLIQNFAIDDKANIETRTSSFINALQPFGGLGREGYFLSSCFMAFVFAGVDHMPGCRKADGEDTLTLHEYVDKQEKETIPALQTQIDDLAKRISAVAAVDFTAISIDALGGKYTTQTAALKVLEQELTSALKQMEKLEAANQDIVQQCEKYLEWAATDTSGDIQKLSYTTNVKKTLEDVKKLSEAVKAKIAAVQKQQSDVAKIATQINKGAHDTIQGKIVALQSQITGLGGLASIQGRITTLSAQGDFAKFYAGFSELEAIISPLLTAASDINAACVACKNTLTDEQAAFFVELGALGGKYNTFKQTQSAKEAKAFNDLSDKAGMHIIAMYEGIMAQTDGDKTSAVANIVKEMQDFHAALQAIYPGITSEQVQTKLAYYLQQRSFDIREFFNNFVTEHKCTTQANFDSELESAISNYQNAISAYRTVDEGVPVGLGMAVTTPLLANIELVKDKLQAMAKKVLPEIAPKKKQIACVDVDGTLLVNGKLNKGLVAFLKAHYDEVWIFTQRGTYIGMRAIVENGAMPIYQLQQLLKAEGLVCQVSTSADVIHKQPGDYFTDHMFAFEKAFVKVTEKVGGKSLNLLQEESWLLEARGQAGYKGLIKKIDPNGQFKLMDYFVFEAQKLVAYMGTKNKQIVMPDPTSRTGGTTLVNSASVTVTQENCFDILQNNYPVDKIDQYENFAQVMKDKYPDFAIEFTAIDDHTNNFTQRGVSPSATPYTIAANIRPILVEAEQNRRARTLTEYTQEYYGRNAQPVLQITATGTKIASSESKGFFSDPLGDESAGHYRAYGLREWHNVVFYTQGHEPTSVAAAKKQLIVPITNKQEYLKDYARVGGDSSYGSERFNSVLVIDGHKIIGQAENKGLLAERLKVLSTSAAVSEVLVNCVDQDQFLFAPMLAFNGYLNSRGVLARSFGEPQLIVTKGTNGEVSVRYRMNYGAIVLVGANSLEVWTANGGLQPRPTVSFDTTYVIKPTAEGQATLEIGKSSVEIYDKSLTCEGGLLEGFVQSAREARATVNEGNDIQIEAIKYTDTVVNLSKTMLFDTMKGIFAVSTYSELVQKAETYTASLAEIATSKLTVGETATPEELIRIENQLMNLSVVLQQISPAMQTKLNELNSVDNVDVGSQVLAAVKKLAEHAKTCAEYSTRLLAVYSSKVSAIASLDLADKTFIKEVLDKEKALQDAHTPQPMDKIVKDYLAEKVASKTGELQALRQHITALMKTLTDAHVDASSIKPYEKMLSRIDKEIARLAKQASVVVRDARTGMLALATEKSIRIRALQYLEAAKLLVNNLGMSDDKREQVLRAIEGGFKPTAMKIDSIKGFKAWLGELEIFLEQSTGLGSETHKQLMLAENICCWHDGAQPVMTFSKHEDKTNPSLTAVQVDIPSCPLTLEQVKDYLKIFENVKPAWFKTLPAFAQKYLTDRWQKFADRIKGGEKADDLADDFRAQFNPLPSSLRSLFGSANRKDSSFLTFDADRNNKSSSHTVSMSTPLPIDLSKSFFGRVTARFKDMFINKYKGTFINEDRLLELTKKTLQQELESHARRYINEHPQTKPGQNQPIEFFAAFQSLLSPGGLFLRFVMDVIGQDNDYFMVKMKNDAAKALNEQVFPLIIDGKEYKFKPTIATTNHPCNAFKGGWKNFLLSRDEEQHRAESVSSFLKGVGKFVDTKHLKGMLLGGASLTEEQNLLLTDSLDSLSYSLGKLKSEGLDNKSSSEETKLYANCVEQIKNIQTRFPNMTADAKKLFAALRGYIEINYKQRYKEIRKDESLFRASFEIIIADKIGGLLAGGCKSAKDRRGVVGLWEKTMELCFELGDGKSYPNAQIVSGENREQFTDKFIEMFRTYHTQYLAGQSAKGTRALKSLKGVLPKDLYAKIESKFPGLLQAEESLAALNKPKPTKPSKPGWFARFWAWITGQPISSSKPKSNLVAQATKQPSSGLTAVNKSEPSVVSSRPRLQSAVTSTSIPTPTSRLQQPTPGVASATAPKRKNEAFRTATTLAGSTMAITSVFGTPIAGAAAGAVMFGVGLVIGAAKNKHDQTLHARVLAARGAETVEQPQHSDEMETTVQHDERMAHIEITIDKNAGTGGKDALAWKGDVELIDRAIKAVAGAQGYTINSDPADIAAAQQGDVIKYAVMQDGKEITDGTLLGTFASQVAQHLIGKEDSNIIVKGTNVKLDPVREVVSNAMDERGDHEYRGPSMSAAAAA